MWQMQADASWLLYNVMVIYLNEECHVAVQAFP